MHRPPPVPPPQEYNICFTTVHRPRDGGPPALPDAPAPGAGMAPLPTVIQSLVQKRRQVKNLMASVRDPTTKQQLNIRQQVGLWRCIHTPGFIIPRLNVSNVQI